MQKILNGASLLSLSNTLEEKLLFNILNSFIAKNTPSNFTNSDFINLEIDLFLNLIKKEGVSHIVYKAIIHNKKLLLNIPNHIIESLKVGYLRNLKKNIISINGLKNLIKLFNLKKIDIIILKGSALIETAYDDPGERSMSDADILIKLKDFAIAHEILISAGYTPVDNPNNNLTPKIQPYLNTYSYQNNEIPLFIHLHWHLINSTIPTESHIYNVDLEKIFNEVITKKIYNVDFKILAPHHQIIHLSEHALRVKHSFNKLILVIDIVKVIIFYKKNLDWDKLIVHAKEFKLDRMVYLALKVCINYFNADVPSDVISTLKPKRLNFGERLFLKNADKNLRRPGLSYPFHLAMNIGVKNKVYFIFRTLFPPKSVTQTRLGKQNIFSSINRLLEIVKVGTKNFICR